MPWTSADFEFSAMTAGEVRAAAGRVTFIPVAQIEAHGQHLPVSADCILTSAICLEAARAAGGIVAPPLTLGNCFDFTCWPGYLVVDTPTLFGIVRGYIKSLSEQGFQRQFYFLMHGGNVYNALILATGEAKSLWPNVDATVACLPNLLGGDLQAVARGGDVDTSLMMAVRPEMVLGSKLVPPPAAVPSWLRTAHTTATRHALSNYFPDAVFSDSALSNGETGRDIMRLAVQRLTALVEV